jgi:hypothetical protein
MNNISSNIFLPWLLRNVGFICLSLGLNESRAKVPLCYNLSSSHRVKYERDISQCLILSKNRKTSDWLNRTNLDDTNSGSLGGQQSFSDTD